MYTNECVKYRILLRIENIILSLRQATEVNCVDLTIIRINRNIKTTYSKSIEPFHCCILKYEDPLHKNFPLKSPNTKFTWMYG